MSGGLCHLRGDVGWGADVITLPICSVALPALFGGQCVPHLNWCDFSICGLLPVPANGTKPPWNGALADHRSGGLSTQSRLWYRAGPAK